MKLRSIKRAVQQRIAHPSSRLPFRVVIKGRAWMSNEYMGLARVVRPFAKYRPTQTVFTISLGEINAETMRMAIFGDQPCV